MSRLVITRGRIYNWFFLTSYHRDYQSTEKAVGEVKLQLPFLMNFHVLHRQGPGEFVYLLVPPLTLIASVFSANNL